MIESGILKDTSGIDSMIAPTRCLPGCVPKKVFLMRVPDRRLRPEPLEACVVSTSILVPDIDSTLRIS